MKKFTATEYLKIAVSNAYGNDKLTWEERIEWFDEVGFENLHKHIKDAEEQAMFMAASKAYYDTTCKKNPTGFGVMLDATSSGMQLLSCFSGDLVGATISNVFAVEGENIRYDAYSFIFDVMKEFYPEVGSNFTRNDLKKAIMTVLYGSESIPQTIFGDYVDAFYDIMDTTIPYVWDLNAKFLELWDPNKDIYQWVLPDGFNAQFYVEDRIVEPFTYKGFELEIGKKVRMPKKKGRALGPNITHSVDGLVDRELTARCMFDTNQVNKIKEILEGNSKYAFSNKENVYMALKLQKLHKESGMLSVRALNYVDNETIHIFGSENIERLINELPEKPFPIISVFDSFRAHPNYVNDLRQQYNNVLSDIAHSDILSHLLTQALDTNIVITKNDTSWLKDIKNSNYALC